VPPQACDDDDVKQNNRNREREREREEKEEREEREKESAAIQVHALLCNSIKNISKYVHLFPSFDIRI